MTFQQFCYLLLGIGAGVWAYHGVARTLIKDIHWSSFGGTIPIARIVTVFCVIALWAEAPTITSAFESAVPFACFLGAALGALAPMNTRIVGTYVLREHSPQGVVNHYFGTWASVTVAKFKLERAQTSYEVGILREDDELLRHVSGEDIAHIGRLIGLSEEQITALTSVLHDPARMWDMKGNSSYE